MGASINWAQEPISPPSSLVIARTDERDALIDADVLVVIERIVAHACPGFL